MGSPQRLPDTPTEAAKARARYHHGSLKAAMLRSAEEILEREGLQGLTLRGAARAAGASHAAPKNHFGDLAGLLSDLAAVGFTRFREAMLEKLRPDRTVAENRLAIGEGYVGFALQNPGLFLLMFRSEKLDMERPALKEAVEAAFAILSGSMAGEGEAATVAPNLSDMARIVGAWSKVHGLAMLLLDGRLDPLTSNLPEDVSQDRFISMVLSGGGGE
jgi:AcrR family transcriptional regulator